MSVTRKEFQFQEIFILILGSKKMSTKTSFGEYFDNQRDRIVKDMQDKNKQQNVEWMERYEKRKKMAKEMLLLKKMAPVGRKENKLLKEMIDDAQV